jgi:hypothetical protein
VAGVEQVSSEDRGTNGDAKPRNLQSLVSLWSALSALVFIFAYQAFRGTALLLAVPVAGFIATVYGVVGLFRARQLGNGRTEAVLGLSLGISIRVVTGIVSFYLWEISRSNWQFWVWRKRPRLPGQRHIFTPVGRVVSGMFGAFQPE